LLTLDMPNPCWRRTGSNPRLKRSVSKRHGWESGGRRTLRPPLEALRNKADALYVVSDALIAANRARIITSALDAHLPTILSYGDYVQAGGLMSYGPDFTNLFRRAADMVDKILRGTKPSDIPVEQPTKFDFAVNVKTATALGLVIPLDVARRCRRSHRMKRRYVIEPIGSAAFPGH
jgi:putative ABC transport system substrate-binding protein